MLKVNEIFFSIQGEGTRVGLPCVFVRLSGCPLRCSYCDTAYAFDEGRPLEERDILAEIKRHPCRLVELTGGEPLSQPAAFAFTRELLDEGYEVLIETSGAISLAGLDPRTVVIMDVKTPGSGQAERMEWGNLELLKPTDEVKLVVTDRADFDWARDLVLSRRWACPVLFSPAHGRLDPAQISDWILSTGIPVRLQLQLHKYIWPERKRGA
jgi:7-carboxy-7-deazaguanine synthase